jgi:hypothetical protein
MVPAPSVSMRHVHDDSSGSVAVCDHAPVGSVAVHTHPCSVRVTHFVPSYTIAWGFPAPPKLSSVVVLSVHDVPPFVLTTGYARPPLIPETATSFVVIAVAARSSARS